jgi:hypothetical protein
LRELSDEDDQNLPALEGIREMKCYKYKGIWIPGCWARALNDNDCHCTPDGPLTLWRKISELTEELAEVKESLKKIEAKERR